MYYFRADGSAVTGAGHLMRCLTIAEELNKRPETAGQICFLCADQDSARLVSEKGFPVQVLHTDCLKMEEELPVLAKLSIKGVFLVDSYFVTDAYLKGLSRYGRIFLLDDMGSHAYPVDGVINYNAFASLKDYTQLYQGRKTQLYVGSRYIPVRSQFLTEGCEIRDRVRDVLITTGGGDSENIASEVLSAVWDSDCRFHVVVGQFSPHFAQWKQRQQEVSQIRIHYHVEDMASLMKSCDLAVTAGGTTVYELAALGVPFLCFSYAENQEALTEYIGREQIAGYCGAYHHDREGTLRRMKLLTQSAREDISLRRQMQQRERLLADGLGASRIAQILNEAGRKSHLE